METLWNARRPWQLLLALGLVSGTVVRLWLALTDHGQYWPDEVYQSMEPAHRMVFGYSLVAWEFVVGARNVLLPGLIAGVLAVFKALHLDDPNLYVPVVRGGFALLSAFTAVGVFRLSRVVGCALPTAVVATLALAWMNLAIYFSPRAMSEVASALPVTWGFVFLLGPPSRRRLVLGASLLGLAVVLRIHCGLFAVGALVTLLVQRRLRDAGLAFMVLLGWAVFYGLLDLVAWGGFLHSALLYLRFNLLEGRAAEFGVSPPSFYTRSLMRSLGAHWWLLAIFGVLGLRRAPAVAAMALLFLLGHIALPHKELRFIVPIFPLFCVAAAAGIESLWAHWRVAGVTALLALLATSVVSLVTFHRLTWHDFGGWESTSAYDSGGSITRLLMAASRRDDLCGLALEVGGRGNTFAYFALHQDVPFYEAPLPPRERGFYNYVISHQGQRQGDVFAADDGVELVRLSPGPCVRDETFEPWLDERTRTLAHDPASLFAR